MAGQKKETDAFRQTSFERFGKIVKLEERVKVLDAEVDYLRMLNTAMAARLGGEQVKRVTKEVELAQRDQEDLEAFRVSGASAACSILTATPWRAGEIWDLAVGRVWMLTGQRRRQVSHEPGWTRYVQADIEMEGDERASPVPQAPPPTANTASTTPAVAGNTNGSSSAASWTDVWLAPSVTNAAATDSPSAAKRTRRASEEPFGFGQHASQIRRPAATRPDHSIWKSPITRPDNAAAGPSTAGPSTASTAVPFPSFFAPRTAAPTTPAPFVFGSGRTSTAPSPSFSFRSTNTPATPAQTLRGFSSATPPPLSAWFPPSSRKTGAQVLGIANPPAPRTSTAGFGSGSGQSSAQVGGERSEVSKDARGEKRKRMSNISERSERDE